MSFSLPIKGRGTAENPANRFDKIDIVLDHTVDDWSPATQVQTVYLKDSTRRIIAHNDSPDVGFEWSINPYRGCEHGCIYCYARPTHEYLGFSAGLDFETNIMVKTDAPQLLREELNDRKWQPASISLSGVTDCYQPVERKLELTRQCLEVLLDFRNPCGIISKSHLVTRDIDLLRELAELNLVNVYLSVTTLNEDVQRVMEPRAATPKRRLDAIRQLSDAGIPVGVMVAPVVPGLTDHELPAILRACADAGARSAGYVPLRLPFGVKDLFEAWLTRHFPDRKGKILSRISDLRGGKLNDPNFGSRMHGYGIWADQLKTVFDLAKRRAGLDQGMPSVTTDHFRRVDRLQPSLFE
jgi:DNA repair photolyase